MKTRSNKKVSRFGLGTYLGAPNYQNDTLLFNILKELVKLDINHIDTAPVYRAERSEEVIGKYLNSSFNVKREDLFITSKVGFVPYHKEIPKNDDEFLKQRFFNKKIIDVKDLTVSWQCFSGNYVKWQIEQIFERLKTSYLDVLYLHNPEVFIRDRKNNGYEDLFEDAFSVLKKYVKSKKILNLGIATWDGLISENSINLFKLNEAFKKFFGEGIFKYVMMPFSSAMPEAVLKKTQVDTEKKVSAASAIKKLGLNFISSGPLYNGKLSTITPPEEIKQFGEKKWSNAQHHINFVKHANFIDSILIGVKQEKNLKELFEVVDFKYDEKNIFYKMLGIKK